MRVETRESLEDVLHGIAMMGTRLQDWDFDWKVTDLEGGWLIQSSFERHDVDNPNAGIDSPLKRGFGRKWHVERGATQESVVFTTWMAIQQIVVHELHESFTCEVNGRQVRLLDPHKSLEDLAVGSREA